MGTMQISTKRLLLREYGPGDLDAVHAFASDPVVCAFAEWGPNTPQETAEFWGNVPGSRLRFHGRPGPWRLPWAARSSVRWR